MYYYLGILIAHPRPGRIERATTTIEIDQNPDFLLIWKVHSERSDEKRRYNQRHCSETQYVCLYRIKGSQ